MTSPHEGRENHAPTTVSRSAASGLIEIYNMILIYSFDNHLNGGPFNLSTVILYDGNEM